MPSTSRLTTAALCALTCAIALPGVAAGAERPAIVAAQPAGTGLRVPALPSLPYAPRVPHAVVPWGTPLVNGADWAGSNAALGDLNVYSNGNGYQDQPAPDGIGLDYECVELAARWTWLRYGQHGWPVQYAYQMYDVAPALSVPFDQLPNGGAVPPQFGDLLVFDQVPGLSVSGHVAVVADTGPGYVDVVEQNWNNNNPTGRARLPISGTYMPARWNLPIRGWLRSSTASNGLVGNNGPGGYTVDGYGGVHPYGSARPTSATSNWPGWDISRGIARIGTTSSGYVLDGFGGLHPFGGAPYLNASGYWPNWDITRGLALARNGQSGYVLDAFGGIHPIGSAPPVLLTGYWPGWDIARSIALRPDGHSGYVLDGWGGIHPFGIPGDVPAIPVLTGYWPGWDIARGITVRSDGASGWVADGWNGIHPFGNAPAARGDGWLPGQDVTRGITASDDGGGFTVTAWGRVRSFGDAPPVTTSSYFNDPVARGVS